MRMKQMFCMHSELVDRMKQKTVIIMQLNNYIYETLVSLYMINYGAKQACSSDIHQEGGLSHADTNIFSCSNHTSIIFKT